MSISLQVAEELLDAIEQDVLKALYGMAIFKQLNGAQFQRDRLRALISGRSLGMIHNHIRQSLLNEFTLAICRSSDPNNSKSERRSWPRLKALIEPIQFDFIDRRLANDEIVNGQRGEQKTAQKQAEFAAEVCGFISDLKNFLKSSQLKRIRAERDNALAHNLNVERLGYTLGDADYVIQCSVDLLCQAKKVVSNQSYYPDYFIEEADIQSERFWDLVTLGFEQNEKNSAEELRLAKGQDRT